MKRNSYFVLFIVLFSCILFGCGSQGSTAKNSNPATNAKLQTYTTSIVSVISKHIPAYREEKIEVLSESSRIKGVELLIPAEASTKDKVVTIARVDGPPTLPDRALNFVGAPIDLGPDGTIFAVPITIKIPYSDRDLQRAGIEDKSALKLYSYNRTTKIWTEEKDVINDTQGMTITARISHFSFYSLVGLSGEPPTDFGTPQPGDILFFQSTLDEGKTFGWVPGHEIMYVGQKTWDNSNENFADETVKRTHKYNLVHAYPKKGVKRSYYRVPNTPSENDPEADPLPAGFMGSRQPSRFSLSLEQRNGAVAFVESQIGQPYAMAQLIGNIFFATSASAIKGPSFDCTGLTEKAYEMVGANGGQGIVSYDELDVLTPQEKYRLTEPAGTVHGGGGEWTEI